MCRYLAREIIVIRYRHIAGCQSLYSYIFSVSGGAWLRAGLPPVYLIYMLRLPRQRHGVSPLPRPQTRQPTRPYSVAYSAHSHSCRHTVTRTHYLPHPEGEVKDKPARRRGRGLTAHYKPPRRGLNLGLYKIFVYFEAVVHESCILDPCIPSAHLHCPPWCSTIARLLHSIRLPFQPPVCMLCTIHYW